MLGYIPELVEKSGVIMGRASEIGSPVRRGRPGLKPGQTNGGSFRPGPDPRRHVPSGPRDHVKRQFQDLCQDHTPKAVETLAEAMTSPDAAWKDRLLAAEMLIQHGHGKAVDRIQIASLDGAGATPTTMSLVDLRAKASVLLAEQEEIDVEYSEVTDVCN